MRKLKRTVTLLIVAAAALAFFALLTALPDRLAFSGGDSYVFYVGNTSKNCRMVTCTAQDAGVTRLTLSQVCGESATFSTFDKEEFLASVNGEILFVEELSDSVNYYCKADLPYSVNLYGEQINLHICVKQEGVTVASPIIFGGY